ncbi:MAG: hypothetical protein ACP5H5_03760 [Pyrobaculum sp.]
MDYGQIVNTVVSVGQTLSQILVMLITEALKNPYQGLIYGAVMVVLSKFGRVIFWTGVLVIAYSMLTLIGPQLGIKLPWS